MIEHIQNHHREILLDPDTGELRPVVRSEINESLKEEADPFEDPFLDYDYLERTYFVCDICDDISLDRQQLENHVKSEHEDGKGCKEAFQSKRLSTSSFKKARKSRYMFCRITSPEMQYTVNKSEDEPTKGSDKNVKNCVRSMKTNEGNFMPKIPANSTKVSKTSTKYQCRKCDQILNNYMHAKRHFLSHYYYVFDGLLPSNTCPICKKDHRDGSTLRTHYAFAHKKLFELVPGLTNESMMKSIKETAIEN